MTRIFPIWFFAFTSTILIAGENDDKINQAPYLPDVVKEFYLGMTFYEFMELRAISEMDLSNNAAFIYLEYSEYNINQDVATISYRFDMHKEDIEATQPKHTSPLYQIEIQYKKTFNLNALTEKLYGKPAENHPPTDINRIFDKQWSIKVPENLTLLIRQTGNRLMIAGLIKGTEWSVD